MVGKYRLVAELGTGGMAHVFLAVMRGPHGFNKLVVLKVPRDSVASDPNLLAMFHEEARLAARLNHTNVVQTYEVIHEEGRDITVMEYLDGQPLHKVLARARKIGKPLPLGMHLRLICDALTGLHYVHEAKDFDGTPLELVHRDVSPPNLFVTFDGSVKVLDFGIAKAVTSVHETQIGTFKGRIRYMPPEQLMGGKIDRRADIFALGAILWDAAVGESMWKGRTDVEVISAVVGDEVPTPKSIHSDVPDELDTIVRKAMSHEPQKRHATCLELQAEIEAFLAKLPDKHSSRDLATHMSELFAQIRAERQRIIESQLAKLSSLPTGEYAPLAQMDLPRSSLASLTGSSRIPSGSTTPSGPRSLEAITEGSLPSTRRLSLDTAISAAQPTKRSNASMMLLGLGAIAVVGAAVFVGRSYKGGTDAPAPVAAPSALGAGAVNAQASSVTSPAAAGGSAATPATEIVTVLRAEPSDARLFLDDTPLASNPSIQRGPRDTSTHTVRAEAKGYASKSTTVVMHTDSDVVLRLEKETPTYQPRSYARPARAQKEPAVSAAPTLPPQPPSATASAPPPAENKTNKKQARPIDTDNPWSK
ncbi:serine/threonine protein kinase [Pendulispora rubella]|uniref:Serine/threonine protein kinase n=1 Tax=Pendulispora rubella TaxID=2741070 RepID=A0ABZ2LGI2_9BACT